MNTGIVKIAVAAAVLALASACASPGPYRPANSMIGAAEFDAMISVQVREIPSAPVDETLVADAG